MPRPPVGRTFLIAISLLGLIALAQVAALVWRTLSPEPAPALTTAPPQVVKPESASPSLETAPPQPQTLAPSLPATPALDIAAAEEQIAAAAELEVLASLPKATPPPLAPPAPAAQEPVIRPRAPHSASSPEARVNGLVHLARVLRERGDNSTALTRLREAQVILPNHALIISELALTYERMQLPQKAIEQWRRIYDFGEKAGIYYAAAEAKLYLHQQPPQRASHAPVATDAPTWDNSAVGLDGQPLNENARLLSLGKVGTTHDTGNNESLRRLRLQVPIFAYPGSRISVEDVVIQVFFYDRLGNGLLEETNAEINSAWARRVSAEGEAMVDWSSPEPEVLEVDYQQVEAQAATPEGSQTRNYFGYVVRVYYNGVLNAAQAEPAALLTQFPPPQTLPPASNDLPQ